MMGRCIVMALLLCFSLFALFSLGFPVTTEARTLAAYSSSAVNDDHYFPPPTEEGSREKTIRRTPRRSPLVPRSPVGGTNKPYIRPMYPPPPPIKA
uniref:Uncharacterized protein n=1 Tax=Picea sitchensis TaxID=3332 RepID=A9NQJ7_PICSI|nr:unknown [Picea sitchensis]ABR18128.1 unknown [Picea sitchensis]